MGKRQEKLEELKKKLIVLLEKSEVFEIEIDDQEPSYLHLVNEETLSELLHLKSQHNFEINETEVDGIKMEKNLKRYGFDRACKIFNPHSPCYNYTIQIYKKYKQVIDRQKVIERLDEEYEVWANSYKKYSFEELEASKADKVFIDEQRREVLSKIKEAKNELNYIKENFESLDVRVTSIDRAREYATIHFSVEDDEKQKKLHVNITKINVLWFKKREDRSIESFLMGATHAFGDVYYQNLQKRG